MKLIGNAKGMKYYPKTIKSVQPTKHKYGANVTWSAHTDTYKPTLAGHGIDAEINAFKYNLQLTILISPTTDKIYENDIRNVLATGRFDAGVYFRTTYPIQEQVDFFHNITGKYASYWSYGNGLRDHDDFVLNNSLLTRLSQSGETSYDFEERLQHRVATVFNYDVRDNDTLYALGYAETILNQAITESGWYNDFSHWHWAEQYGDIDQLEQFFSAQRNLLNTTNSITLGAGEAIEYMWLRKLYKRGGLYQDGNDIILMSDVRNDVNLPFKTVNTSLSVEVDLTGTILEGKEIQSNAGIISKGNYQYIVQVPYSNHDGFRTVRLKETITPNYLDFSLPVIQSVVKNGDKLNIETDKPTNVVAFGVPVGGRLYEAEIVGRSNTMSTNHSINVPDLTGKDLYIGAITKEKQSVLSNSYNF